MTWLKLGPKHRYCPFIDQTIKGISTGNWFSSSLIPDCPALIPVFHLLSLCRVWNQSRKHILIWHLNFNRRQRSTLRRQSCDVSPLLIVSCWGRSWQWPRWALCLSWKSRQRACVTAGRVNALWWALTCCERVCDSAAFSGSTNTTEEHELWSHPAVWCVCVFLWL